MKKIFLIKLLLILFLGASAQDSVYTRKIITELTSKKFGGRGYVKNGDKIAAKFIANEYSKTHLISHTNVKSKDNDYYQDFSFDVNTFPGNLKISLNNFLLIPGRDYIVNPECSSIKGKFDIVVLNKDNFNNIQSNVNGKFILIDTVGIIPSITKQEVNVIISSFTNAIGFIFIEEQKLTWSVGSKQKKPEIKILRKSIPPQTINQIDIVVDAKLINHKSQNIIGYLPGTLNTDTMIVISAHYDHLGKMGKKTIFPGANDNASGISMLLNLAKYYSVNQHKYPIAFICFAGEEAGLIGSSYYTTNPIYPLEKIKFLLNLDLLGTGDDGLMVVNGSVFENEWNRMDSINSSQNLLPKIGKRGKAQNSDHYYFTEKGVPSFFCYTLGGRTAYHDIYDIASTLPLTKYKETFKLLQLFIDSF